MSRRPLDGALQLNLHSNINPIIEEERGGGDEGVGQNRSSGGHMGGTDVPRMSNRVVSESRSVILSDAIAQIVGMKDALLEEVREPRATVESNSKDVGVANDARRYCSFTA